MKEVKIQMKQSKINISDIIGESQTQTLIQHSTLLDRKLTSILVQGKGKNTTANFKIGDTCFDIITYKHAAPCVIMDSWIENNWHKYLVSDNGQQWVVQECDLVHRKI